MVVILLLIAEKEPIIIGIKIKILTNGFVQNIVLEYLGKKSNRTGNFLIECHQIRGKSQWDNPEPSFVTKEGVETRRWQPKDEKSMVKG